MEMITGSTDYLDSLIADMQLIKDQCQIGIKVSWIDWGNVQHLAKSEFYI